MTLALHDTTVRVQPSIEFRHIFSGQHTINLFHYYFICYLLFNICLFLFAQLKRIDFHFGRAANRRLLRRLRVGAALTIIPILPLPTGYPLRTYCSILN